MPPTGLVIDLVSSPEVPLPPPRKPTALPAEALSYGQSKPANHGVIELLSDETDEWPLEEPKLESNGLFGGSSWSFSALDSTIDQPAPSVKTANKIYQPNTTREERQSAKGVPTSLEKPAKIVKGADDFYFLEDDFDSTVNFDDSSISHLPSAKKRRLSPSPKVSTKLSTGGYSRSLSNIEPNTSAKTTVKGDASASLKRAYSTSRRVDSDPITFSSSFDPVADAARRKKEKAKIDVDFDSDLDDFPPLGNVSNKPKGQLYTGKEGKIGHIFTPLSDTTDDDSIVALEQLPDSLSKQSFAKLDSKSVSSKGKPSNFDFDDFSDSDPPDVDTSKPNPKIKSKCQPQPTQKTNKFSSTAADILADYASSDTGQDDIDAGRSKPKSNSRSRMKDSSTEGVLAEYIATRAKERAARAKRDAAAEKKAAKEAERQQKQLEKERKAREKQKEKEIATVNTLRTDKKLTTPEMIVELSSCLEKKLTSQTKTFLEDVKATYTEWESTYPIVRWKRKVVAEYDEGEGLWKPVPEFIRPEKHVLYIITAKELVQHVTGDSIHDLNTLVALMRSMFESSKIIFLIEGVTAWTRRNRNIKNREYDAAVRSYGPQQPITSRRKRVEDQYVDEEVVENALLELQILHGCQIHHTGSMPETAQWIKLFTENISSIPYK
jgi:crossover junction endonuclease EME1